MARFSPLSRRGFIATSIGAAGTAAAFGGYTWRIEPHWLEVVHQELPFVGLPSSMEGARVVQISDLHVGTIVDSSYLCRCLEQVAECGPDLVVLTGDFITHGDDPSIDEMARVMESLRSPSLGCLAVLGNHDYGWKWCRLETAAQVSDRLEGLGIRVLRNEAVEVNGLTVVGLDDLWGKNFVPEPALDSLDRSKPMLALCHNPDVQDLPIWEGLKGWTLSGHTHGGQCKPPFLPPPFLPVANRRYVSGVYEISANRSLYINRGLGYLRRVRFNVRPEVSVFTLTSV